ncbi:hypothetical protein AB1Y20_013552 [Prymnesium parvum]|uniref:Peptidylprolyl isomerase n=1 Tax=Prymnesium parvum TaxID=97485 RepID=A0AB34II69_PRYPA
MVLWVLALAAAAAAAEDCRDEHDGCVQWAQAGECDKNPSFMKTTCAVSCHSCPAPLDPSLTRLGDEEVSLEVEGFGTIKLGFFPNAAPITVKHILSLFRLGCYDTNHIFRVDKGFVAQIQSVSESSVTVPLSDECKREAVKTVPAEFTAVRHVRGTLSMGRMSDPDSGGSSFSMLLGRAAHLDHQYTVFGKVLAGDDVLSKLEQVETRKEGIFVMPKTRITISRAVVSTIEGALHDKEL